jgi:hypothetical protein
MVCTDQHKTIIEEACDAADDQLANVTGFFLVFPSCFAVQLEGRPHTINAILNAVDEGTGKLTCADVCVISSTDDIPSRAHAQLNWAFVGTDSRSQAEALDMAAATSAASEINLKFIAFGQEMRCVAASIHASCTSEPGNIIWASQISKSARTTSCPGKYCNLLGGNA